LEYNEEKWVSSVDDWNCRSLVQETTEVKISPIYIFTINEPKRKKLLAVEKKSFCQIKAFLPITMGISTTNN
jgi:hypothetical protein